MRNIGGQVQGPPDFLLRNPEAVPTIYDPALAESNPRAGAEAALAAFDTQFSSSLTWEKLDTPQNVSPAYAAIFPNVNQSDLSTFQARLQKVTPTGGTFALTHEVDYAKTNNPSQDYIADWNVKLVAEMRQPILQGAGVQFNRIAGPGATPAPSTASWWRESTPISPWPISRPPYATWSATWKSPTGSCTSITAASTR